MKKENNVYTNGWGIELLTSEKESSQITYPFNKKLGRFVRDFFNFIL